ncbi:MAG: HEAT repeat domain-containing protein [Candidatus Hodarchaeota archaeon]
MSDNRNQEKPSIIRSISTLVKAARGEIIIPSKHLQLLVLNDSDPNIRAQALIALCHQNKTFPTDVVLKLLNEDPSTHVRCAAALCLDGQTNNVAILSLIERLQKDSDHHVRMYLLEALGHNISEDIGQLLLEMMNKDPSVMVRSVAAGLLFEGGGEEFLFKLSTSPNFCERRAALRGLKHVKSSKIGPIITKMARNDPEFRIRKLATRLLHELNNPNRKKGNY